VRRRLVLAASAITLTVILCFAIPLGLLVRRVANDRALQAADRSARTLVPVVASVRDRATVERVVQGVSTASAGSVSVIEADGSILGPPALVDEDVTLARRGRSFTADVPGGRRLLDPVVTPDGSVAVISVFVPSVALDRGVRSAWLVLAGLSLAILLVAVAVADRLARTITEPVAELATTAERLGQGDLDARVEPAGPPEIVEVGETLNRLAGRITGLLAAERELVADLSHRLRTPITALRLDAESLRNADERAHMGDDVDQVVRSLDQLITEARRDDRRLPSSCDLADITRHRLDFWGVLLEEQDRPFDVALPPVPALVPVAPADLEAAIDALVGNVVAHTPDGVSLSVSVAPGSGGWELVVDDDGPGFAHDGVAVRGTSGGGSTGLGLDIAQRTAERTGGSMRLGRSPSGGARVVMTFGRLGPDVGGGGAGGAPSGGAGSEVGAI
jgi:signal transduction histidine kinase